MSLSLLKHSHQILFALGISTQILSVAHKPLRILCSLLSAMHASLSLAPCATTTFASSFSSLRSTISFPQEPSCRLFPLLEIVSRPYASPDFSLLKHDIFREANLA